MWTISSSANRRSWRETAAAFTNCGRLPIIVTIRMGLANKLVGGTLGALSLGFDAVRHVAWLLSYHVDRTAHEVEHSEEES